MDLAVPVVQVARFSLLQLPHQLPVSLSGACVLMPLLVDPIAQVQEVEPVALEPMTVGRVLVAVLWHQLLLLPQPQLPHQLPVSLSGACVLMPLLVDPIAQVQEVEPVALEPMTVGRVLVAVLWHQLLLLPLVPPQH
jgi:hypothetical protein